MSHSSAFVMASHIRRQQEEIDRLRAEVEALRGLLHEVAETMEGHSAWPTRGLARECTCVWCRAVAASSGGSK